MVTYIGFRGDTHDFKMRVRPIFRFRFRQFGIRSCRPNSFWPKVQDADNVIPLNENALVL
jgi:hypothetical protein